MKKLAWLLLLAPLPLLAACLGDEEGGIAVPPLPVETKPVPEGRPSTAGPETPVAQAPPAAVPERGSEGGSPSIPLDAVSLERKIVYNARLDLEVGDVDRAVADVVAQATALGGFLVNPNVRDEGEGEQRRRVAEVTVRVPASVYGDALGRFCALASRVRSETVQSNDVTEEYADLDARLRNLRATEARYLELLAQARNVGEVLQVQDRLNAVRLEIERVQGRLNLLDRLSDMATITVRLQPPPPAVSEAPWRPSDVAADAWEALQAVMQALATAAIYFAIVGGWLLALVGLAVLVWRRWTPARGGA